MRDWRRAVRAPISYTVPNEVVRLQTTFVSVIAILGTFVLFILYLMLPSRTSSPAYYKYHDTLHDDHIHSSGSGFGSRRINVVSSLVTNPNVITTNCSSAKDDGKAESAYNSTYPLSKPVVISSKEIKYRIALIADLDMNSRNGNYNEWHSFLLKGWLTHYTSDDDATSLRKGRKSGIGGQANGDQKIENTVRDRIKITWDRKRIQLTSTIASGSRGMELSELVVFNGKLYSCDDRTGIVYEIVTNDGDQSPLDPVQGQRSTQGSESNPGPGSKVTRKSKAIPRFLLTDGDGNVEKGFKCEWMTVKGSHLIVGGFGKEWTTSTGDVLNHDPQFIKNISVDGVVRHINWLGNYDKLKLEAGIQSPGYLIHESAIWSSIHEKWFFLPRRASSTAYNELEDEQKGTNLLISANESFEVINVKTIGPVIATHGFSFC